MKIQVKISSFLAALFSALLLSALAVFIIWSMRDRARLIRDNENEQLFNMLFTGLQDYDDFGSAIEANATLRERIAGFAVYDNHLSLLYSWGKVPGTFDENILRENIPRGRFGRYTIPDKTKHSVKFVLHTGRMEPPAPPDMHHRPQPPGMRQGFPFSNIQGRGRYYYVDITHAPYWRTITITAALLPLCCIVILGASFYIRHLYLRNREYREKIEAQKNLVVLGTAAGTLAHEIKNPLLSIRLQTGILRKTISGSGQDEIGIIEEEVSRLSELTYRVNDYLREPEGNPQRVNASELLADTARRLCGRDIMEKDSLQKTSVKFDPDRLRSVFENIIRNALESESPPDEISASIRRISGQAFLITVSDRGRGVNEEDRQRVFDPFFTRKSTGTGIGLSISRRFIEAAGGKIELENRDSGGVTVSITVNEYVEKEKAET
ncbi:hypothetical protein AGMMS49928_12550 [Spirochaetia bacterium]|nr:hypothetical protein AGMMS49928_12550 [Spirochaetia bacterium]